MGLDPRMFAADSRSSSYSHTQTAAGFIVPGLERVEVLVPTQLEKKEVLSHLRKKCEKDFGGSGLGEDGKES